MEKPRLMLKIEMKEIGVKEKAKRIKVVTKIEAKEEAILVRLIISSFNKIVLF